MTFFAPHPSGSVFMCAQGVWTFGFRKGCFIAGLTPRPEKKINFKYNHLRRPVQTHTVIHTRKSVCVRGAHGQAKKEGEE